MPKAAPNAVEYLVEDTFFGRWRRYAPETGSHFAEYKSHWTLFGLPWLHRTRGVCPETGAPRPAKGVLAIGRYAIGIVALGQTAIGLVALGQFSLGVLFGFGQAATGLVAVGQVGLGGLFGAGQAATGQVAIGQFAYGDYVLAQVGYGNHLWTTKLADPTAVALFQDGYARLQEHWQALRYSVTSLLQTVTVQP